MKPLVVAVEGVEGFGVLIALDGPMGTAVFADGSFHRIELSKMTAVQPELIAQRAWYELYPPVEPSDGPEELHGRLTALTRKEVE